ncbi:hypothetical protein EV426DRAFT_589148 [Tirmania nivea]|nr:hypothetical protein EV426DRAFT_589148 [Tirmania nivea]
MCNPGQRHRVRLTPTTSTTPTTKILGYWDYRSTFLAETLPRWISAHFNDEWEEGRTYIIAQLFPVFLTFVIGIATCASANNWWGYLASGCTILLGVVMSYFVVGIQLRKEERREQDREE